MMLSTGRHGGDHDERTTTMRTWQQAYIFTILLCVTALVAAYTVGHNVGAGGSPILGDGSVSCDVWEDGSATCSFSPGRKWAEDGGTLSGCLTTQEGRPRYLCTD